MGGKFIARITAEQHANVVENLRKQMKDAKTNHKGCILLQMVPSKENGYVQLFVKGTKSKILAHVLALFQDHNELQAILANDAEYFDKKDVSHLCGNRLCVNPKHLVAEDSTKNQRRKGCKGIIKVVCPCGCNHEFTVQTCACDDNMKCI